MPKYVCRETDNINMNFFWQDNCDNNSPHLTIHSIAWNKICHPKREGGLDIRKPENTNKVFLAKQAWKIFNSI